MVEPNNEAKEGEYGWIESELESDNLVDAMKEALATKDIFVAEVADNKAETPNLEPALAS